MTTQIISDVNFNDPGNLIPYLEKDDSIIRAVTKGMFDFSNPATYGGGALAAGATVTGLTSDAATATATNGLPAQASGMIDLGGASKILSLPNTFKVPGTCKRFLAIIWAKLPAGGWQTGSSNANQMLGGVLSNVGTSCQWGIVVSTIQASGLPNNMSYYTPDNGGAGTSRGIGNAATLAVCDGNLHQLGILFDAESTVGQANRQLFIDKVSKDSFTFAWDGTLSAGVTPQIGPVAAFQQNAPVGMKFGRPSFWDLTGTTWTPAQILQRDWDAAQGFLS